MKARVAFYKGDGNIVDKAIKWWTKSNYSHVELVVGDVWYSTSPRDLEVRAAHINPKVENWDYVDVTVNEYSLNSFFDETKGSKYDWTGIFLSQFFPLGLHSRERWFCSEWVAEVLGLPDSNEFSPEDLYNKLNS